MARIIRSPVVTAPIAQRLRQLDRHLQQRLLHVEDMRGTMFEELGAMAPQCPQRDEVRVRTKRGCQ
jgi:hypothetical protein